jgi:hypothetical protein
MQLTSGNLSPSVAQPPAIEQPPMIQENPDGFHWINNEGLLRDEGALFGIAGADIKDKMNAIESFYKTRTAEPMLIKQFLEQKIQEHDLVISVNRKVLADISSQLKSTREKNNFLPALLQLLAVMGVCVFNYFVVSWWLSPAVDSYLICAGIYLSGLFSFYISRTLNNEETEENVQPQKGWKINLRELAVAAGVALFICVLTFRSYPPAHSLAAFLILCIIFSAGKVLMSSFFNFKEEGSTWLHFYSERSGLKKQSKELSKAIEKSAAAIETARTEIQEPSIRLKKLEAEHEYKTRIFLSEYNLALQGRNNVTKSPAKEFA